MATDRGARNEITLLGGFRVCADKTELTIPEGARRLIAFLTLARRPVLRTKLAGVLWPDVTEKQALGSLRSTLWRLQGPAYEMLEVFPLEIGLAADVRVDFHESSALAHRLVDISTDVNEADLQPECVEQLSDDLLPDWYDNWVVEETEKWRQLRLHALESLSVRLLAAGRFADALTAALSACAADPLRESAQAAVMRVHLAEGNRSEAIRAFDHYSALLLEELGLEPSDSLRSLANSEALTEVKI